MTVFHYPEKLFLEYTQECANRSETDFLREAISLAERNEPISASILCRWHEALTNQSSLLSNKQKSLQALLEQANRTLIDPSKAWQGFEKVQFIAENFYEFMQLSPFTSENDAIARLYINYLNSRLLSPIYVFRFSEYEEIEGAKKDLDRSKQYFAKKITEAAFDHGFHYLTCVSNSGDSYLYQDKEKRLVIEWHELQQFLKT